MKGIGVPSGVRGWPIGVRARLVVAKVEKSCLMCILTQNQIPRNFSIVCLYQIWLIWRLLW